MTPAPGGRRFAAAVGWADRLLPAWFAGWCLVRLVQLGMFPGTHLAGWDFSWFGRDFLIYRNAAAALLAGSSPFDASAPWNGVAWHYAAPPTAAQAFVPFALIPEGVGIAVFAVLSAAAVLLALRRIGLPWWWILFPPVQEGLMALNPQLLVFGLLFIGGVPGRALAAALKIYAVVPMVARREGRALLGVAAVVAASVAVGSSTWLEYLRRYGEIGGRLLRESEGGLSMTLFLRPEVMPTYAALLLIGVVVLMLLLAAIRDVRSAGWLALPLLWPASEYHQAMFAIPIARRPSTWLLAVPTIPSYLVGFLLLAWEVTAGRRGLAPEPQPEGLAAWLRALAAAWRGRGRSRPADGSVAAGGSGQGQAR